MMRQIFVIVLLAGSMAAVTADSWQKSVPEKTRARSNPFASDETAPVAGAKLFQQHCAQCHGQDAHGKGNKPSLQTNVVQQAAPGELEWLLKNGSLKKGMPSWSRLPEEQRWQLVSYIKTLNRK
jgi:mono/diheme cytochrome c family protein